MATAKLTAEAPRWNSATRVGFRFLFVYFFVSILTPFGQVGAMLWSPLGIYETVSSWWMSAVGLVGDWVFGATVAPVFNGSGDTQFNYVEVFCWAAIASAATVIWSIADRKRLSYPRLFEVLRVALRLFLALEMIVYGTSKVLPVQFGTLLPSRLVTPVGELSPMGLLWTFMAASPCYTFFGGAAELLGGLLLVFRRTTLLGALVCAGVMTQVVMLNLCYDVPVKLFSSQLLAMAIFLTLPDAKRLWSFFVEGRPIAPAPIRPRFKRRWLNWSITSATVGLFVLLTLQGVINDYSYCQASGIFGPSLPLQGVWDVVEYERDGEVIPPLATDPIRWNELLFQNTGSGAWVVAKSMLGRPKLSMVEFAEGARRMTLTDLQNTENPPLVLTYEEPAPDTLVLSGTVSGKKLRVELHRAPKERFTLVNRGFHWINEMPFNR
jgi:hypothetical protein